MNLASLSGYFRRYRLLTLMGLITLVTVCGALVISFVEARANPALDSFTGSVWWVLVSMTTVGYGDIVPVTGAGRFLGVLIIFAGVALVSMFTATISSIFVAQKLKEERGLKQVTARQHIILCGWNHTAHHILQNIFQNSNPPPLVLINQLPEDQIQNILFKFQDYPLEFVRGDFAQEEILNRANISKARAVLIIPDASRGMSARNDEKTILTAFSVKAIQPKIKVYAHILDHENEAYLKKAQVDDYLISDAFSGVLMGKMVTMPGVPQSFATMLKGAEETPLQRVPVPRELVGKSFAEALTFFRQKNLLPIGIVKEQQPLSLNQVLSEDYSYLDEFIERKFRESGRSLKKAGEIDVQLNPPDNTVLERDSFLLVIK
ncbi:MAG: ion channel [Calditrichia bacterium]